MHNVFLRLCSSKVVVLNRLNMNTKERTECTFVAIVENFVFVVNKKASNYKSVIANIL